MMDGSSRGRRVDFSQYATSFFNPFLFHEDRARLGCGATALALVTGVPPEIIAARNGRAHYSDKFMVSFLRQRHFRVQPLTKRCIVASTSGIGRRHVVLLSQWFRAEDATWGVMSGGCFYHNFERYWLDQFSFLNKPILSAYLLFHERWRVDTMPAIGEPSRIGASKQPT